MRREEVYNGTSAFILRECTEEILLIVKILYLWFDHDHTI